MKLSDLVSLGLGELTGEDVEFSSVSTDTRNLKQGESFVALRGENFDANTFVNQAVLKGCCAVVVDSDTDASVPVLKVQDTTKALGLIANKFRAGFSGKVVAITGSSGKTSVKGMLKSILDGVGHCLATEANFNNHIGVPLTLLRLEDSFDYAVVEAGMSNPGEIAYLARLIEADIAVVINVMPAHIENFESLTAIAHEKAEIYGGVESRGVAIINLDDDNKDVMVKRAGGQSLIGFTTRPDVDDPRFLGVPTLVTEEHQVDHLGKVSFTVRVNDEVESVPLKVIGTHHLQNALAALACAWSLGVPLSQAKKGLADFSGEKGRMQMVLQTEALSLIDDSYNANPGSMKAAIDYLSCFDNSILICGEMAELGERTQAMHAEVGEYARAKGITKVLSCGGKAQFLSKAFGVEGEHFENKDVLVDSLKDLDKGDTVVLVKGSRSAKMEEVVDMLSKRWGNI